MSGAALRLDHTVGREQRDEAVAVESFSALLAEMLDLAPALSMPDRKALYGRVDTLRKELQAAHERLAERLNGVGRGRRALLGYGTAHTSPEPPLLRSRA